MKGSYIGFFNLPNRRAPKVLFFSGRGRKRKKERGRERTSGRERKNKVTLCHCADRKKRRCWVTELIIPDWDPDSVTPQVWMYSPRLPSTDQRTGVIFITKKRGNI